MIDEYELKELEEILKELIHASSSGAIIIVEGPSDRDSLRNIGVQGIILIASTKPNVEIVDSIERGSRVIILTDWDLEGKKMGKDLSEKLKSVGIIADLEFRKKLFKVVGKDIKNIENLSSYYIKSRQIIASKRRF